jgi:transcriptional regulator with XRE-family HTH domain
MISLTYCMTLALFAGRLRELRTGKGLTQQELAERSGITQGLISQYESGRVKPITGNLLKLARALNCTVEDITGDPRAKGIEPAMGRFGNAHSFGQETHPRHEPGRGHLHPGMDRPPAGQLPAIGGDSLPPPPVHRHPAIRGPPPSNTLIFSPVAPRSSSLIPTPAFHPWRSQRPASVRN